MQRQNVQTTMDVDEAKDENLQKIVDSVVAGVPEEFLLGSITTNAAAKEEKGMQIRSSARVFKKMKLEQEQDKKHEDSSDPSLTSPNSDQPTPVGPVEKSTEHEAKGQPLRSSTRVVNKKIKQDLCQSMTVTETSKGNKPEVKRDIKKEARIWSLEDKLMFFDAINEFGKDFENIQQYINSKLKKKGVLEEQMRSKEHVRYFYIKTFHEISKYVKFSDGIKKVVQELYGIINYGELYKKIGGMSDKVLIKLNELIYRGTTVVRVKGVNKRIRTPICRALIKLNQLDEKYEEVKLPHRVTVELRPKDMTSYVKVQCLAQNPRVKTTLPIQKRLNALFQCLNKRWKTVDVFTYEKSAISTNPITNDCVPLKEEVEEKVKLVTPALRLSPPSEAKIELPSINISEYLTRQTICLTAYESRLGLDTYSEIEKMMSKKKKPKLILDVIEPKVESCDTTTLVKIEPKKEEENEATNYFENEPDSLLADAAHDAINTILSLQSLDRQHSETSETEELSVKTDNKSGIIQKSERPKVSEEDLEHIESIKKGWTEATSESLTVGEIYLMYGSDAKLILEYSWGTEVNEELERPKKSAANFLEMWNDSYEESWELRQKNLTSSLSKLLSLAKLNYRETAVKCHCGHVCNEKPIKNTSMGNSRMRRNIDTNGSANPLKAEDNSLVTAGGDMKNEKSEATSGLFRTPMHILSNGPNIQAPTMQQQLNSIQKLKPKFTNRKGRRFRQKPIVVERKLPLLPNNLSGHQIVRMSIKSQESPIIPAAEAKVDPEQDFDLQKVIDPEEEHSNISTVPSSPSKILQEGENEWMNAEVGDYSLSSLLGHLESPVKPPVAMASEISNEVDAQLRCLMTESSMDFAASFADLAESVASVSDRKF